MRFLGIFFFPAPLSLKTGNGASFPLGDGVVARTGKIVARGVDRGRGGVCF